MVIDTSSKFPQQVDPLLFLEDVGCDQVEAQNTYTELINASKYDEANEYIKEQTLNQLDADIFNAIDNRLETTQKYIKEHKQSITYYGEDDPPTIQKNMLWIV